MAAVQTRPVPKERYHIYLRKAEQAYGLLQVALERGWWEGAGLAAVHCVISANDALCVFYLQERAAGQRHAEAAELLRRIRLPGIEEKVNQYSDVVREKNKAEYFDTPFNEKTARRVAKQTNRFFHFVQEELPKIEA